MKRLRLATMLVAVALLDACAAGTSGRQGPTSAAPTHLSADRVGIAVGSPFGAPQSVDGALADIAAAGCGWIRADVDWSVVERERGVFSWAGTDELVAAAARHHVKVLGVLAYTPSWARPQGTGDKHPPADVADFARFAGAAAGRYGRGAVPAWEIWNEPNSASFWAPRPDVTGYADLLRATARAIRAVDASATIVTGGLAPAVDAPDGSEIAPETFLGRLLATGAGNSFDAVGSHPYSYPELPSDPSTSSWNSFARLPVLHELLASDGVGDRPIWITEVGAATGSSRRAVSEEVQALIVRDALVTANQLPWVARVFVYSYRDRGDDPADPEANFGLQRFDGSPKPSWSALAELLLR